MGDDLLFYSEWLDLQGLMVSVEDSGDDRTHEDLVSDYRASLG